jgi:hypothetical protein
MIVHHPSHLYVSNPHPSPAHHTMVPIRCSANATPDLSAVTGSPGSSSADDERDWPRFAQLTSANSDDPVGPRPLDDVSRSPCSPTRVNIRDTRHRSLLGATPH